MDAEESGKCYAGRVLENHGYSKPAPMTSKLGSDIRTSGHQDIGSLSSDIDSAQPLTEKMCIYLPISKSAHALRQVSPRLKFGVYDGTDIYFGQGMADQGSKVLREASECIVSSLCIVSTYIIIIGGWISRRYLEAMDKAQQKRLLHRSCIIMFCGCETVTLA